MNFWRGVYAFCLCLVVAVPLLAPFRELTQAEAWRWTADDGARLRHLSINTISLTLGTAAIALPLGLSLAVLLFRIPLVARGLFLFVLALCLFIPLPIVVSSWQGSLGADGWLPLLFFSGTEDRPWATGLLAAVWIHALAAAPWATCIIGLGLTWVEPEREEEAALLTGPWGVLLCVTLPRARASIVAALVFVALQTAGEISVTDMMVVGTLAEEVHTQFTLGRHAALARTLVISLPALLLAWGLALYIIARLEKTLPPMLLPTRTSRALALGGIGTRSIGAVLFVSLLVAPLVSLAWKVGLEGHPPRWSAGVAWHFLRAEAVLNGRDLATTLVTTLVTGFLVSWLALLGCWLARDCRWFRWLLFSALIWAWVLPGSVIGIGLHETIMAIVTHLPDGPCEVLKTLLYNRPSPVPQMWAQGIRALPIAVVFLWPIVRMIPRELFESARLEGGGLIGEWMYVVWPMTRRGFFVTAVAASALSLGEVAATIRVETPGWQSYMKLLFDRMHSGVGNDVAALGILMLGSLAGCAAMVLLASWLIRN